ncbi:DMT family transporter [Paenibacillus whitsoniae]|uniref:DMT family transporter n=1 Tax=Paenibacillus whitsoniae TaxID=2496558 RepID=A0A3S0IDS6_9BACL|nr:DMT family transporter [Paenibacillus whitsoniae]RTE10710.1 DMT family transporter [Paenibacillus whitsoniae]
MTKFHGRKLAYSFAVLNATIIGFSFLFAKIALDYASPLDTLTLRFAASFAVMSIPVVFGWTKLNYRGKPLHKVLLLAAMYPLGFFTLQAYGLKHASSAEAGILYAFTPIATMMLASLFLKETTTVFQKLSVLLSVAGVVFIFAMKGGGIDLSNLMGIGFLLLTCLAFAGYSVMARSLASQFSPAEITYLMLGTGFVTFSIVSLTTHGAAGTLDLLFQPLASSVFVASILFLGVISSLVTALTSNYVLSILSASRMSVFSNLSTIVSIGAGAIFLGERITAAAIIGSIFIICGVVGANRQKQHQANHTRASVKTRDSSAS